MQRTATISCDGAYRYILGRQWSAPVVDYLSPALDLWIMLNPSTANADIDDPTIRRCVGFSKRWGADGLRVVNLFALRATNPTSLRGHADPVGPENDRYLHLMAGYADAHGGRKIAAWGADPSVGERAAKVMTVLGGGVWALGTTKAGRPRHPLYVKGDAELVPYGERAA